MELKNENYLVASIAKHSGAGPAEVNSGTNMASRVVQEASGVRRQRIRGAILEHCKVAKQQNAPLVV